MTREQWLQSFIDLSRPLFEEVGAPIPETVRASIGFCSTGRRGNRIGECWADIYSADGVCEIFIVPSLQSNDIELAATLTHELIHAAVGHEAKHGPKFKKPALALGLTGKMTATSAGEKWVELHQPILDELGRFPGEALKTGTNGVKKQSTRMIKVECNDCGWTFRATKQRIEEMTDHTCLACGEGTLGVQ